MTVIASCVPYMDIVAGIPHCFPLFLEQVSERKRIRPTSQIKFVVVRKLKREILCTWTTVGVLQVQHGKDQCVIFPISHGNIFNRKSLLRNNILTRTPVMSESQILDQNLDPVVTGDAKMWTTQNTEEQERKKEKKKTTTTGIPLNVFSNCAQKLFVFFFFLKKRQMC